MSQLGPILNSCRQPGARHVAVEIDQRAGQGPAGDQCQRQTGSGIADQIMRDLRETSPQLPQITRDIGASTASIPVLLGMTQQTLAELEALLHQLRNSWLLYGGGATTPGGGRLPPKRCDHEAHPDTTCHAPCAC